VLWAHHGTVVASLPSFVWAAPARTPCWLPQLVEQVAEQIADGAVSGSRARGRLLRLVRQVATHKQRAPSLSKGKHRVDV
jgi:hypothetical protein